MDLTSNKMSQKQVLVIHGGNAFNSYEEYLAFLKAREFTLDSLDYKDWKKRLSETLGSEYQVVTPSMPNGQNAKYAEWKIWFERILPFIEDGVILVGHSLGGIFLAKYLSENDFPKKISGTFLVAPVFSSQNDNPLGDFLLSDDLEKIQMQSGQVFLYHSMDDTIVPFDHHLKYKEKLPNAHTETFTDRGHFRGEQFPELVRDITTLSTN